jgi:hypothetical protein
MCFFGILTILDMWEGLKDVISVSCGCNSTNIAMYMCVYACVSQIFPKVSTKPLLVLRPGS